MKLSSKEIIIILILALLTALEALSIDLYLPAFHSIATEMKTDIGKVQVSLSTFIGGFAMGQLLWGPLSDRFGRKIPLIAATLLYALISLMVLYTTSIEELWLFRFLQAFTGSAGVVIARAIVTDIFDKDRTSSIFALLGLIMGIAPIIAPSIGTYLLHLGHWYNAFIAMAALGFLSVLLVFFGLPETNRKPEQKDKTKKNLIQSYQHVFRSRDFLLYTLIGSMSYSALMIYISNSPNIIMEKAGFKGTTYSIIFAVNAIGMMIASFSVTQLTKKFSREILVKYSAFIQIILAILMITVILTQASVIYLLILIFLFLLPTSILFPTTTDLALQPFLTDNGLASALLGFSQLAVTFIFSGIINVIQGDSVLPMTIALLLCGLISFVITYIKPEANNKLKSIKRKNIISSPKPKH